MFESLLHELQGASAVALEVAGDHETDVLIVVVRERCRGEKPPVLVVDLDDAFAEVIDLLIAAKLVKAGDGQLKVFADKRGIVLRIEGELTQPFIGDLE